MNRVDRLHIFSLPGDCSFDRLLEILDLPPAKDLPTSGAQRALLLSRFLGKEGIKTLTTASLPEEYTWLQRVAQYRQASGPFVLLGTKEGPDYRIAWGTNGYPQTTPTGCWVVRSFRKPPPDPTAILALPGVVDCFVLPALQSETAFQLIVLIRPDAPDLTLLLDPLRPCTVSWQPRIIQERFLVQIPLT